MTINNIIYENEFNSIKNTLIIVYENTLIAINRTAHCSFIDPLIQHLTNCKSSTQNIQA